MDKGRLAVNSKGRKMSPSFVLKLLLMPKLDIPAGHRGSPSLWKFTANTGGSKPMQTALAVLKVDKTRRSIGRRSYRSMALGYAQMQG